MAKKILIVEDEFVIAQDLQIILEKLHYEVVGIAQSEGEVRQLLNQVKPDVVLLDILLKGDKSGIDIAQMLNEHYQVPFVFVSSFADEDTIARVKETHPFGYILKPFNERDIYVAIELCLSKADNLRLAVQNQYLNEEITQYYNFENMVGESDSMQQIFRLIKRVAPTDTTVLIQGETGTGKELIARAVHSLSRRSNQTMIKVNCAALPSELLESELFGHEKGAFTGAIQKRIGKLELAHQSTIFLDEIGELPLASQAKLLRFLQEREVEPLGGNQVRSVDVRVIAATNRNLAEEVQEDRFRQDLYFRLNVLPI
ncbi:MAG: sigma-54 dependent transcriptional regulator, partial [Bacteroidota bacterium]